MRLERGVLSLSLILLFTAFLLSGAGGVSLMEAPGSPVEIAAIRPQAIAVGDFNNDGNLDLAVASLKCDPEKDDRADCYPAARSGQVSILVGEEQGRFEEFYLSDVRRSPYRVPASPQAIAVGDFDNDGNQDFVTVHPEDDKVIVKRGNGQVEFYRARPRPDIPVGGAPFSVAIGDFNNDGNQDIATVNMTDATVAILFGDGTGEPAGFSSPIYFEVGKAPQSIILADFNDDGQLDLATVNADRFESISVLLNDGTGNFDISHISLGIISHSIAAADLDGDGNLDLVLTNTSDNNVSVLLGQGNGSFGNATDFATGADPSAVAVGDFNQDEALDLVVISGSKNSASVMLNDGSGQFELTTTVKVGKVPVGLAVGDFNGDGKPDLAIANSASDDVTILLNR